MAAKDVALPVADVARLSVHEEDLLAAAVAAGSRLCAGFAALPPDRMREMDGPARFLFRRWVLEVLLLLRARGPLGFNDIARALGNLAGESLAPKVQDLVAAGLVLRREEGRRVRYGLGPAGAPLAAATVALTFGKAEHARAVHEPEYAPRGLAALRLRSGPRTQDLAAYRQAVEDFAAAHLPRSAPDLEARLAVTRRFARACVHKWHGDVLATLLVAGPLRFSDLRGAIPAGSQALTSALRGLESLRSVERAEGAYRLTDLGRFDLALGLPMLLLLPRSSPPDQVQPA